MVVPPAIALSALLLSPPSRDGARGQLLGLCLGASVAGAVAGSVLVARWFGTLPAPLQAEREAGVTSPDQLPTAAEPGGRSTPAGGIDEFRQAIVDDSAERLRRNLVIAEEQERRRIAEGLHDDTLQILTAASLRINLLGAGLNEEDTVVLGDAAAAVRAAIDRIRRLIFDLYPPALDRYGLIPALATYGAELCDSTPTVFRVGGTMEGASTTAQSLTYRVTRELVMNACKHAGARSINVHVQGTTLGIGVRVADDGIGFEKDERVDRPGHLGLDHAQNLVEGAGGSFALASGPGKGMVVSVWVPDTGDKPMRAVSLPP